MMNCIILDDEPLALLKLTEYIRQIPFLTLEKACMETTEAKRLLEEKPSTCYLLTLICRT